jgi:hypothetical protein
MRKMACIECDWLGVMSDTVKDKVQHFDQSFRTDEYTCPLCQSPCEEIETNRKAEYRKYGRKRVGKCNCSSVKRYDDYWQCMRGDCRRKFIPDDKSRVEIPPWIWVKDELPPMRIRVLGYYPNNEEPYASVFYRQEYHTFEGKYGIAAWRLLGAGDSPPQEESDGRSCPLPTGEK